MNFILVAAQVSAAFNLTCVGTERFQGQQSTPYQTEIRVDLRAMRFCQDACKSTTPIKQVTDEDIVFVYQTPDEGGTQQFVNRESGAYISRITDGASVLLLQTGDCTPGPFTGFPAKRF